MSHRWSMTHDACVKCGSWGSEMEDGVIRHCSPAFNCFVRLMNYNFMYLWGIKRLPRRWARRLAFGNVYGLVMIGPLLVFSFGITGYWPFLVLIPIVGLLAVNDIRKWKGNWHE